jgi:beta-glucosidase
MPHSPASARVESLLASMTLPEKIGQLTMVNADHGPGGRELAPHNLNAIRAGTAGSALNLWGGERTREAQRLAVAESRLGVPMLLAYDVIHGQSTVFPIPLGEAAALDPALWEATARAAAIEAASDGVALTFAPMLDTARDPRWGRIAESFGEDPWLGARYAEAKVRGFQHGALSDPDVVGATAKHFCAYGAAEAGREYASVDMSRRRLHEIYLPPFEAAVRAGVAAIMPSFNDLCGVPMTANAAMLRGELRERWGFHGVIVSDFTAVAELIAHGVASDLAEAAALALNAGVDIDMVSDAYPKGLPEALERGLIQIAAINEAVRRVLTLKERLGLFEAPYGRGETPLAPETFARHRALAREAARRSIVLLQDRDGVLPLRGASGRRLAVIGPLAHAREEMHGCWAGAGDAARATTFLEGLTEALPGWRIDYAKGSGVLDGGPEALAEALELARASDVVLLCLGEAALMSGEAASRARPDIPAPQRRLAEAVFEAGKPVIVTLSSGRPLTAPWLFELAQFDLAPAVLATWFLGDEAGGALADVLTGRWSPSGRLTVSWPRLVGQIPICYGRLPTGRPADPANTMTSRYLDTPTEPQFPFGHGLSYGRFVYSDLRVSPSSVGPDGRITAEADIVNEGVAAGEETAFLFIRDRVASVSRPLLELKGMARLTLAPGERGTARFSLAVREMAFFDEDGAARLEEGEFEIFVGPSADPAGLLRGCVRAVSGGD